jgi:hypothetical protein
MTVLGFIAALVQALAWPVVVLIVAIIFHRQVKTLLSEQLKRFKAGPVEVEWERQVLRVETLVEPIKPSLDGTKESLVNELGSIADELPELAVLEAFDRVTLKLRPLLTGDEPETERPYSRLREKLRTAADRGRINLEAARAIEGMQVLRNLAAHKAGEISPQRAAEYLALADAVIYSLASGKEPGSAG